MTIDELTKELESLQAEVSILDAKDQELEQKQQNFEDASKILIELVRKGQRRLAYHKQRVAKIEQLTR